MKKENYQMKMGMMPENGTPERIYAFSNGVFAIIIYHYDP